MRPAMDLEELRSLSLGPADAGELYRQYDSEVHHVDTHLGRLLDHLEARSLDEQTLVMVTASHGEELLDHGGLGCGHTLHRELLDVPLVVRFPSGRGPAGVISDAPVELVDLFPTVLDVIDSPRPDGLAGQSLRSPVGQDRPLLAGLGTHRSVRLGAHKLVLDRSTDEGWVYDLEADPAELAPSVEVPSELRALLSPE